MTTQEELAARYGASRRRPWTRALVAVAALGYLGVAAWVGLALSQRGVEGNLLGWRAVEREVSVDLELRGTAEQGVACVLKATDAQSVDVGYRTVEVPPPPATVTVTIPTVIRAASVTVLGCEPRGSELRVPPPDFPPGVAIP